ncbi:MAG: hypothetical protein MZV63_67185 [Marinilabiliales bacterium]|nr:hypothetical protein [Marinilabiliales bacterium]
MQTLRLKGHYSKIVARGSTSTPFGDYTIKVCDEPAILSGEKVTSYLITYQNSPVSLENKWLTRRKTARTTSSFQKGLSVMYSCNGAYFGVKKIDDKVWQGRYSDRRNKSRQD